MQFVGSISGEVSDPSPSETTDGPTPHHGGQCGHHRILPSPSCLLFRPFRGARLPPPVHPRTATGLPQSMLFCDFLSAEQLGLKQAPLTEAHGTRSGIRATVRGQLLPGSPLPAPLPGQADLLPPCLQAALCCCRPVLFFLFPFFLDSKSSSFLSACRAAAVLIPYAEWL